MTKFSESELENFIIEFFRAQGYLYLSLEDQENIRESTTDVLLRKNLRTAIHRLNPGISADGREQALREVINLPSQNLIENNKLFYLMLVEGISVENQIKGETIGKKVKLIDFEDPLNNDFLVCNQFTVKENNQTRRPDVVLFVNGLPLVVIELKNPADENATIQKAYEQIQNYKNAIPSLFAYNGVLAIADGPYAKAGSLTSDWSYFMTWKTVDGVREESTSVPQIETLINGMLRPDVLLDLVRNFTVFEQVEKVNPATGVKTLESSKKIAAYHQYHAVNAALKSTVKACSKKGDKKAGVVWHTQGSGKSLSMVFYAGKLALDSRMENPTIVVITDRNDLDDQLHQTFANCRDLLRQEPTQAENRAQLKELLKTAGGGIVFTTIQKFSPEGTEENYEQLSDRRNIVVIADEAHRSHYGFAAKTSVKDNEEVHTRHGFAKYLRDALPNASFVGFTGTPIEKEDASTRAVFGDYIDTYDIHRAVDDNATVEILYDSHLVQVHLDEDEREKLDEEIEEITEDEELAAAEKTKSQWARVAAIVGSRERLKKVAEDIVSHFEGRRESFEGKGMIVTMSRQIAVDLYDEIVKLRPDWHDPDKMKGSIKVVMTSSSSDPQSWQQHFTTKQDRRELANRFKDPDNPLDLVIVRDMWLTGFDVPCLHTMYIDKAMKGHTLMQAIARVNRVYKDKPGGLIVDYIGIGSSLKHAISVYTDSGGEGRPTLDLQDAIDAMNEKYEVVAQLLEGFDYKRYFSADVREKLGVIMEAQDYILGLDEGKERFTKEVALLSKASALTMPAQAALDLKEELAFFQAVRASLLKFDPKEGGRSAVEIETAIKQIVDKALVVEGIVNIFDAAGIQKPEISVLSNDFLDEVLSMKHKNLALELLKKILNDQIRERSRTNLSQSRKFSEMLDNAIRKYQNNMLSTVEIIEELIDVAIEELVGIAKKMASADKEMEELGLSPDEVAFYGALAENESAQEVLGDETLRDLARIIAEQIREKATLDWKIKESVRAKLRVTVKRLLKKYGYPPDQQKLATDNIIQQAELFADEQSA